MAASYVTICPAVKGDRPMRLICQALFNHHRIKAHGTPIRYDDTTATYEINVDGKLSKARTAELTTFVQGMIAGFRACDLI